jgi:iron complex outermembrane receptor protein
MARGWRIKGSAMTCRHGARTFWLSTAAGLAWVSCASAQTPPDGQTTDAGSVGSAAQVGDVVVTAEKRPERLLQVPAPVAAISGAQMLRLHAVSILDLSSQTAGLAVTSDRVGDTHLVIRGISTSSTSASSTVATYIDDTPFGSSTEFSNGGLLVPDLDPADLEQVEVLKGPQGTLYGASALGGLIKYVTTPPSLTNFGARAEVDGSAVDQGGDGYGVRGSLNVPLVSDVLGVRISAYSREDPGYIDDPTLGRKNVNDGRVDGGRVSVLWQPTAHLSVRLSALLQDVESSGTNDEDVNPTTFRPLTGDLTQTRATREPLTVANRLYDATVNYDLGWATLMSATSYGTIREHRIYDFTDSYGPLLSGALGIPNIGVGFSVPIRQDKYSQEVRLTSAPGKWIDWIGGFFFTQENSSEVETFDPFDTVTRLPLVLPPLLYANLEEHYTEYAGYGDVVVHLTSKFDVQGGLRYSENTQHYVQPSSGLLAGPSTTLVAESSDQSVTFLVSPRYKFDENNMVYGRIASGYQPGGPNALSQAEIAAGIARQFKPDTLTNYELGYKASLLDHKVTLDASVFYIDWRNIQVLSEFNGFNFLGNAASATSDGVEATATYSPIDGLNLSFNGAYTDAKLTANAPGYGGRSGDQLPNTPRWAGTWNADYNFPIHSDYLAFVGGSVRYVGDEASGFISGAPAGFSRPTLPAYATLDLRAGVKHASWSVELYAKNATNTRGFLDIHSLAFNSYSAPWTASVIQPLTVGFSIANRF